VLDRAWLLARIPHQGDMCLLDSVLEFDPLRIRCRAVSHRDPANPLRHAGRLGAACGIEYAAQAMAAHGAALADLAGDARPRAGFLASVRGVDLRVTRLDDLAEDLEVEAERLSGDHNNILYGFQVRAGGRLLLAGRATVILDTARLAGGERGTAA
jgi:predicted hotdog family 3-hydroxylacyl-ACP dehydratase